MMPLERSVAVELELALVLHCLVLRGLKLHLALVLMAWAEVLRELHRTLLMPSCIDDLGAGYLMRSQGPARLMRYSVLLLQWDDGTSWKMPSVIGLLAHWHPLRLWAPEMPNRAIALFPGRCQRHLLLATTVANVGGGNCRAHHGLLTRMSAIAFSFSVTHVPSAMLAMG